MKKLLSRIFVALAIIGMVTFIAPKKAMAESQPDCYQIKIRCADGSDHGYALICDKEDWKLLMEIYCNSIVVSICD